MGRYWRAGVLLGVIGISAFALPGWAAGDGQLITLDMRVEEAIAGLPALPPHALSRQVCWAFGTFDPKALAELQASTQCTMTHYARQGDVVTFDVSCAGPQPTASHGEFHMTGGMGFTGSMHTTAQAAGHDITIDTTYTGTPGAACTPPPKQATG